MSSEWRFQESIGAGFTEELAETVDTVNESLEDVEDALEFAEELLQTLASVSNVTGNPLQALISSLLEVIEGFIEDFTQPNTVHSITIPLSGVQNTIENIQNIERQIEGVEGASRQQLLQAQNVLAQRFDLIPDGTSSSVGDGLIEGIIQINQFLNNVTDVQGLGGNHRIFMELFKSLYDAGDPNRPQFTQEDTVAGILIVYGSSNPLEAIRQALAIGDIFRDVNNIPTVQSLPVPQNVKGKLIGAQSANAADRKQDVVIPGSGAVTDGGSTVQFDLGNDVREEYAAKLRWDNPELSPKPELFDDIDITKIHVFHKKGGKIQPEDLGQIEDNENLNKKVVAYENIPIVPSSIESIDSAVIDGIELDDTEHYFAVGYTVKTSKTIRKDGEAQTFEEPIEPTFATLSNQVRINPRERVGGSKTSASTPPDWNMLSVPATAIPPAYDMLVEAEQFIENTQDVYNDVRNEYADLLELLGDDIPTDFINAIQTRINRILYLIDALEGGIWIGTFQGVGGKRRIVESYGELLTEGGSEAPPFRTGTEFTGAISFVTGSSVNADAVTTLIDTINAVAS